MAQQLVFGLAKWTVEGTLSIAKSAVEEDENMKKSMQRNLMLISDEFEMMHSFLNVAKERATDEMVRTLVRQVRNTALDVEDCIETIFLVDIDKSRWWRRVPRLLVPCIVPDAKTAALDKAVAAADLIKSRVEAMGQRNERYGHIRDPGPKTTEKTQQASANAAAVGILKEARDAKKKGGRPRDLAKLIMKNDSAFLPLQIMSLWGSVGDLGVASIIKKTFDDPDIGKKFSSRAWVKLMRPFNPLKFLQSIMAQFYTNSSPQQGTTGEFLKKTDEMMAMQRSKLIEVFLKHMSDHKCLIFLEDMSSTVDWEAVRLYLPDKKNGSCIVVHTQQLEVASLIVGQSPQVLELEQFSPDHSVCVFYNETRSRADLIELIKMKDNISTPFQVISVCGKVDNLREAMKHIIERTCCDHSNTEICRNRFRYRAWLNMQKTVDPFGLVLPLDLTVFIDNLLDQLCTNYCAQNGTSEDFLKLECLRKVTEVARKEEFVKQVMKSQKYIVVLEAVSSKQDFDAVRKYLPAKTDGSCIVVHTEDPKVASLCVAEPNGELEVQLSADQSVRVFFKKGNDEVWAKKIKVAKEWIKENELIGRGPDIDYISRGTGPVQPVFGIAGVGKSYIVRHVYFKKIIDRKKPFDKFGWVDVSHPFNMVDFSWSLLLDLHSGCLNQGSMLRIRDPIQECRDLLQEQACLIVIDGLQSKEEWDAIKDGLAINEHGRNKSHIIVIANEESVATYCCSRNWWNVEGLEIEEALQLFNSTVDKKRRSESSWPSDPEASSEVPEAPDDNERVKFVLHKCGGLPQVIVAVGEFIRDGWSLSRLDNFMPQLETRQEFGSLRNLFTWVNSYFNSCPDSLKPCIFYLSIFPVNHKIRRRRLVRRWIAEGYSMATKESTAEEEGKKAFVELCKHTMIQVPGSASLTYYLASMPSCKVNGFFREYIKSQSMEENLLFALEGQCCVNSQRTGRHLTIEKTWDRDISLYQSIDFSRLRSLTVYGKWESFFISDKMNIVRVLDLEDASSVTDGDLEQMVKLLPRLKFLSLRGCKEITRLPYSFGRRMRQLQTLDIRHTSIVALPPSITKLKKLMYIHAGTSVKLDYTTSSSSPVGVGSSLLPAPAEISVSLSSGTGGSCSQRRTATTLVSCHCHCWLPELCAPRVHRLVSGSRKGGVEVPRGIGEMVAIHNMSVIDVSAASGRAILEELKNLTQLRKLGVSGIKQDNHKELCSVISDHPHLKSLSVWLDKNQGRCLDAIFPPPEGLKSLKLYGYVDRLPEWFKLLSNLQKLKLGMAMITQFDINLLKYLPSLQVFNLSSKDFEYEVLRFKGTGCFRTLLVLEIACNSRLQFLIFEPHVMPWLEVLKIRCDHVPSLEVSGLHNLRCLREVSLSGSFDDRVRSHLKGKLKGHPNEVEPILKVNKDRH